MPHFFSEPSAERVEGKRGSRLVGSLLKAELQHLAKTFPARSMSVGQPHASSKFVASRNLSNTSKTQFNNAAVVINFKNPLCVPKLSYLRFDTPAGHKLQHAV
jgi:hypothetical protein